MLTIETEACFDAIEYWKHCVRKVNNAKPGKQIQCTHTLDDIDNVHTA